MADTAANTAVALAQGKELSQNRVVLATELVGRDSPAPCHHGGKWKAERGSQPHERADPSPRVGSTVCRMTATRRRTLIGDTVVAGRFEPSRQYLRNG
jgi:hypothetical protein